MKFNQSVTKQPRKKRKAMYNAPMHVKQRLLHLHLSKDLRKKFKTRSLVAKKGDKVKIMRGQFFKVEGKITEVDVEGTRIFVEGAIVKKQAGKEIPAAIHPSNCMLIEWAEPKHKEKKAKGKSAAKPAVKAEAPKKVVAKPVAATV